MNRSSAVRELTRPVVVLLFLLTWSGCRPAPDAPTIQEATVVGTDYSFDAPEVMPAGRTAFAFDNRGNVPHEMILVKLKDGLTTQDVLTRMQEGASPEELVDGGAHILIAGPGETTPGRILLDLESGREYALVCNFRDTPEAPQHTELGMFRGFRAE